MFECTAIQHFKFFFLKTNLETTDFTDACKLTKVREYTAITVLQAMNKAKIKRVLPFYGCLA